jgi:hypothetical protein
MRYDYAVVRVVPRVERGEFVNAGVVACCAQAGWLGCAIELDPARLLALDAHADLEMVEQSLAALQAHCGAASRRPRELRQAFDFLVATRSTVVQVSPVHVGLTRQLDGLIEQLLDRFVRPPRAPR